MAVVRGTVSLVVALLIASGLGIGIGSPPVGGAEESQDGPRRAASEALPERPLAALAAAAGNFLENDGQVRHPSIRYYASAAGLRVGLGLGEVWIVVPTGVALRLTFPGAAPVVPVGIEEQGSRTNFLIGPDPAAWHTDLRSYAAVVYRDLYPGIDLVYRSSAAGAKYEFHAAAGADLSQLALAYEGAEGVRVDSGRLLVETVAGTLVDEVPASYLVGGGPVSCGFAARPEATFGIECPSWDGSTSLVVDPFLWVTYVGGTGYDSSYAIALDSSGYVYIAGTTDSTEASFPVTPGAFDPTSNGMEDVFVAKLAGSGDSLLLATYLGGDADDYTQALALGPSGSVFLAGDTTSTTVPYPTTPGAFNQVSVGGYDAFVSRLNASFASLDYSTLLGGTATDRIWAIAVDAMGAAHVTGQTNSADFNTTVGAFQTSIGGSADMFVTNVSPDGASLLFSTYLGGTGSESGGGIDLDSDGNVYVCGDTASSEASMPLVNPYDGTYGGSTDAYVGILNATGDTLLYGSYIGGASNDYCSDLFLDPGGGTYLLGTTYTSNTTFPVTVGAYDVSHNGLRDIFVGRLNESGLSLDFMTYLGSTQEDFAGDVATGPGGRVWVGGTSLNSTFPTTPGAPDDLFEGPREAVVAILSPNGSSLLFSTFLGGSASDNGGWLALDSAGYAYVTGYTTSSETTFPVTPGAYDVTYDGFSDAFVAKLGDTTNLTVDTSPSGLEVLVNGQSVTAPVDYTCAVDGPVNIEAPSPQYPTAGVRNDFVNWSDGEAAAGRDVTCEANATYTAVFSTLWNVTFITDPPGLNVTVDSVDYVTPVTFAWNSTLHVIDAPYQDINGSARYGWKNWSDGGGSAHGYQATGVETVTATYALEYAMSVETVPAFAGIDFWVDDVLYTGAAFSWWEANSTHWLNVTPMNGTFWDNWTFAGWSDSSLSTNRSYLVMGPAALLALYDRYYGFELWVTPYYLEVLVDDVPITPTTDQSPLRFSWLEGTAHWMNASSPQLEANGTRWAFIGWGDGYLEPTRGFTADAANSSTYNIQYGVQNQVTVGTDPEGPTFWADSVAYNSIQMLWWFEDSLHWLNTTNQSTGDANYTFLSWSDSGTANHSVWYDALSPEVFTASFDATYRTTVGTDPSPLDFWVDGGGYNATQEFWWDHGSAHDLNASAVIGDAFESWSFTGWSDGYPLWDYPYVASGPAALLAEYDHYYGILVDASPPGPFLYLDGNPCDTGVGACSMSFPVDTPFWLNASAVHAVSADARYVFSGWSDGNASANRSLVANGSVSSLTAYYTIEYRNTVDTSPTWLDVRVDGMWYMASQEFWWAFGSQHDLEANGTQDGLYFAGWSDGGAAVHQVTVLGAETYVANYSAAPVPLNLTASANVTSGYAPLAVQFSAAVFGGEGGYSFLWDFDDGTTNTLEDPAHTFSDPGLHNVTVTVNDTGSNTTSATIPITVSAYPPVLSSCEVLPDPAVVQINATLQFAIIAYDQYGDLFTGYGVVWSTYGGIGTVNGTGLFNATAAGAGTVNATAAVGIDYTATCYAVVTVTLFPPPEVDILTPAAGATIDTPTVQVNGTSQHAAYVQVRVESGAWTNATMVGGNWTLVVDLSPYPNGDVTLQARAVNDTLESLYDSVTVTLALPPTVAITSPTEGAEFAPGNVTVEGTSTRADAVQVSLDNATWVNATGTDSWTAELDISALPDGDVTIAARAVQGLVLAYDSVVIVKQSPLPPGAPTVAITTPGNASVLTLPVVNVAGTATNATLVQVSVDAAEWFNASGTDTWFYLLDLSALPNGTHAIRARAWNNTMESTPATVTITLAVPPPPPTLQVLFPPEAAILNGTVTLLAQSNADIVQVQVDATAPFDLALAGGVWSANLNTSALTEGNHTLTFTAIRFGLLTTVTRTVVVDNVPAPPDADRDGVPDGTDNCPSQPNGDQSDRDVDGTGDVCDATPDGVGGLPVLPLALLLLLVLVGIILLLFLMKRRKGRPEEAAPAEAATGAEEGAEAKKEEKPAEAPAEEKTPSEKPSGPPMVTPGAGGSEEEPKAGEKAEKAEEPSVKAPEGGGKAGEAPGGAAPEDEVARKIRALRGMKEDGLLTEEEFQEKRKELLKRI